VGAELIHVDRQTGGKTEMTKLIVAFRNFANAHVNVQCSVLYTLLLLCYIWPPHSRGFLITHNDAPQSVGVLWTSDQPVAETST
jgi:hypothetical protein